MEAAPWFAALANGTFCVLEWLDESVFRGKLTPLCRLVGRLEPGYYDRTTDWDHPLFVDPKRQPELYLKHAADLCAHGYRQDCPHGCQAAKATLPHWDWQDVWDGPWKIGTEPRRCDQLAIRSGAFTILTVGDYFDGGGPIEERLAWICAVVNAALEAASSQSSAGA